MKHALISVISFIVFGFLNGAIFAQTITVSGFVTDAQTGEALINATFFNTDTYKGTSTNNYGFFSLDIEKGKLHSYQCSYVGYQTHTSQIKTNRDTIVHLYLQRGIEIAEIAVYSNKHLQYLNRPTSSTIVMAASMAALLPRFLGEPDLARMLQLMPGVQSGKEGTSGLNVRGGSNDQNLILLDGMPVYNASHIGGFISVFNPSAVNHLKLYKGGFPAKHGGRLSSILEVNMKEGNLQQKSWGYTFGTLTTSFFYEGPIKKDTSSFIISGRRTLFDLLVSGFNYIDSNGKNNGGYQLWDINMKYNKRLNNNTRYYLSFYNGRDKIFRSARDINSDINNLYKSINKYANSWGNTVFSYRLNKVYAPGTFANYTFGTSNYRYNIDSKAKINDENGYKGSSRSRFESSITDFVAKADFEHRINNNNQLDFGINTTIHFYSPTKYSTLVTENETTTIDSTWGALNSLVPEFTLYFSDEISINERLSASMGLSVSNYFLKNSTLSYLEPRMVGNYKYGKLSVLKISFTRMVQFGHLVSSNDQAFPSDLWFPSTEFIRPETSFQYAIGTVHGFHKKQDYQISFELFYKDLRNLMELKSGSSFLGGTSNWEEQIITGGKGFVAGSELLIEKKTGRTTGWLAYTLSKNMRKFDQFNNNKWFPFKYDRRHELSIVVNHQLSERVHFSANWVFMSGEALTIPRYKFLVNTMIFEDSEALFDTFHEAHFYDGINSFRAPAYHRFDINFNFVKISDYGERTISLGLYNAYNRANPYYLYFDKNEKGEMKLFALTLFPVIPSISYSFRF